ncbi:MAG: serine/threonine protein kinase [Cyanomargarita calcarea GSE-NOS-MK-12-04C]|uniref:non-specific serine/threonine protein kinase n=1 Tax=Cyanomargarita calcarea GSE-NOS-MK-12-04C TaxID=2839659 RepID=A0A951UTV2_9CYAN|nr:serine/threonine protein kinase [Cyanomargarita calcarea GSE-NOS-MK-12-04C]
MNHHMIGKVLQARYQIVQNLGAGVFGQTYIAVDIDQPQNPKCVVKQLKVTSSQPSYLDTLRLRFLTETETLKHLGHHNQIPQLVTCFEENERFYLVQEFIEGHALTAELPINRNPGYLWNESEVIQLLQDVLSILEFVHSQGVIHCDVKPENIIRRACDGKLVLIDFGSIVPVDFGVDTVLPIYRIPVTSLGYIPPEQFIGQTQPNSDIYSLGMIAIQAISGMTPLQLKIDSHTNEIIWRSQDTQVSDYLASILSQMIRYSYKERFFSAAGVLQALQEMSLFPQQQIVEAPYTVENIHPSRPNNDQSSPLLMGMKVGLAANSLVMGFGVYSLISNSPAYSETEMLYQATKEYQSGDLQKAIALAKSIPSNSNVYPEAQATIDEWQQQWQIAAEEYNTTQKAFDEERWSDVLRVAPRVPDILYWQGKTEKLVKQAKVNLGGDTNNLLAKAYEKASVKDFNAALDYLHQIPAKSASPVVQKKVAEYGQKRGVRASHFLQKAYNKAESRDFDGAVKFLKQVPSSTPVYATAQAKLIEYTQKQRLLAAKSSSLDILQSKRTKEEEDQTGRSQVSTNMTDSFISSDSATSLKDFQPGNYLREVNIH